MRTLKEIYGEMSEEEFNIKCLNYKFFCEKVLGHDIQPFHLEWVALAQKHRRVAIQAPTGFGKTTILGNDFCLWISWIQKKKQMCIVSKTLPQSSKILGEIQEEIEGNELLTELIPKNKPISNWCSATSMTLSNGCKIFCRPYSENIKGIHVDYLLGDEVASYDDPDIWHRFVVTRTNAKEGIAVAISTPDNVGDLMQELLNNPEYVGKTYPSLINKKGEGDVEGESIWPSKWPRKKLMTIRNEIGIGKFELEYMCNPKGQQENALYPPHLIQECFDFDAKFLSSVQEGFTVIACDFAIASGPRADFDAYIVLNKIGAKMRLVHGETHKGFPIAAKVMRIEELFKMFRMKLKIDKSKLSPEEIKKLEEEDDSYSKIKIVVDPSNVGQAVLEELKKKALPVQGANFDAISRNGMLINLRQLIENKDISIPRNKEDPMCMRFTDTLVKELISMVETKTKMGNISYQTKAPHDDTVMALAMGASIAYQQKEFMDMMAF